MIVGFVGAGNIASSIARGWAASDAGPEQMLFTDSGSGRAAALAAEVGGEAVESNAELAQRCDLLLLAMKPKELDAIAPEAQGAEIVVSLLGATPLPRIADAFPDATTFRVLPNPAVEVQRGVLCLVAGEAPAETTSKVKALFEPLGRLEELDDSLMDQATMAMGCSMAFFAVAVQAIAEASAVDGLEDDLSLSLTVDTAAGTAEMLRLHSPTELRRLVASPGGDTEAGLEELERKEGAEAFAAAVRASLASSRSRH
jgi:pyrroline-5-carboxylate reductase